MRIYSVIVAGRTMDRSIVAKGLAMMLTGPLTPWKMAIAVAAVKVIL